MKKIMKSILLSGVVSVLTAASSLTAAPVVEKLIILGDSISKHGPAVESLGWSGNWGMAASSEDKDYVHLFLARLTESQGGKAPQLIVFAEGGGTITGKGAVKDKIQAVGADLAVIQLGENDKDVSVAGYKAPYEAIIQGLKAGNPNVRIFCFGVWGQANANGPKDMPIRELCKQYGATYVSLEAANRDPANRAGAEKRFTHAGVNWHPGDKGMQAYADALWQAYQDPAAAAAANATVLASDSAKAIPATVLMTERWDGASGLTWKPDVKIDTGGSKSAAKIVSTDANSGSMYSAVLPVEKFRGHTLRIKARIKGEAISEKPKPWNGVKIMLQLQNAEAKMDYPQAPTNVGTFDWTDINWTWRVPENIVSAKLAIGLEKVQGTLYVESIEIGME